MCVCVCILRIAGRPEPCLSGLHASKLVTQNYLAPRLSAYFKLAFRARQDLAHFAAQREVVPLFAIRTTAYGVPTFPHAAAESATMSHPMPRERHDVSYACAFEEGKGVKAYPCRSHSIRGGRGTFLMRELSTWPQLVQPAPLYRTGHASRSSTACRCVGTSTAEIGRCFDARCPSCARSAIRYLCTSCVHRRVCCRIAPREFLIV